MLLSKDILFLPSTTMAGDVTSNAVKVQGADVFAIQTTFTSTPVGTFKLQVSCDTGVETPEGVTGISNWDDVEGSQMAAIGAAGSHSWTKSHPGYKWVRLIYTRISGSGSLSAKITIYGDGD